MLDHFLQTNSYTRSDNTLGKELYTMMPYFLILTFTVFLNVAATVGATLVR